MSRLARRAAACALVAAAVGLPRAEALIPAETSTTTTLPPIPAVTTTTSTTTIPQIVSATPVPTLAPPTVTEVTTVPGSSLPVGSSSPGPSTIPALTTGPEIPTSLVSTIPTEAPTSLYYSKGISDPLFVPGVDPTTDASFDDALPEEVPFTGAVASTYGAPFTGTSFAAELAKLTAGERQRALDIQARLATATARVEEAKKSLADLTSSGRQSRDDLARLNSLRDKLAVSMRQRALRQYTGESARYLRLILEAKDLNVLRRRTDLISQAQRRDAALVQSYRQSAKSLEVEEAKFNAIREARQFEIDQLADEEAKLKKDFDELTALLGALQAPLAFEGFVFPVQPPYAYTDTYGADRMNGTQFEHKHQGVDIFAREGTPVIATKRGVVYSIGVARLGGNRLWLKDVDGTCYYYAHLVAFASGLYENKIVESGEVLGFVGTTGNAVGTPPHLHYEIHPQCEGPTNPTPILNAVENANLEQYVAAVRPVFGGGALPNGSSPSTTPTVTVPGAGTTSLPVTIPGAGAPPLVGNAPGGSTKVVPTSGVVRRATSVPLPVPSVRKLTVPPPTTARNSTSVPAGTGSIRTSTTIR